MFILMPIPVSQVFIYATAVRLLRPALGAKVPTIADLIAMEMTNRRPQTIAEEYLEFNGYPPLQMCRRKLAEQRRAAGNAKAGRNATAGPCVVRRALRRPAAQGDPGRN